MASLTNISSKVSRLAEEAVATFAAIASSNHLSPGDVYQCVQCADLVLPGDRCFHVHNEPLRCSACAPTINQILARIEQQPEWFHGPVMMKHWALELLRNGSDGDDKPLTVMS
jgi:hypothetical protein